MGFPTRSNSNLTFAHEVLDMWVPDAGKLKASTVSAAIRRAAEEGGLNVLKVSTHKFRPHGFTTFALLSQSHVALHTWPELEYVACDVFSCGGELEKVVRSLVLAVGPEAVYQRMITRGEPTRMGGSTLFLDQTGPGIRTLYDVNLVARYDSQYQHAEVYRHKQLGGMFVMNDDVQFSESDHRLYDDALMRSLQGLRSPQSVLVIGGGDGLCATYLLSNRIARRVRVLELDPMVTAVCKRHFPKLSWGLSDPRTEVRYGDACETILDVPNRSFDAVVIDTTAPDTNRGYGTYAVDFLRQVRRVLRPGGQICMNGTSVWFKYEMSADTVQRNIRRVFPDVSCDVAWIPSFGSPWSFYHATAQPARSHAGGS